MSDEKKTTPTGRVLVLGDRHAGDPPGPTLLDLLQGQGFPLGYITTFYGRRSHRIDPTLRLPFILDTEGPSDLGRWSKELGVDTGGGSRQDSVPLPALELNYEEIEKRVLASLTEEAPRATWTPEVGKMFLTHGPGKKFTPDGQGGGTLTWTETVHRKGFRPKTTKRTIQKSPRGA